VKWCVVCNESIQDYDAELHEQVIAHFSFEGDSRKYAVYFEPVEGTSFEQLQENLYTGLERVLEPYSWRDIGEMLQLKKPEISATKPKGKGKKKPRKKKSP